MRILSAALISTLLTLAVAGTLLVDFGIADPMPTEPVTVPPEIYILSPEVDKTYNVSSVVLTFDGQDSPMLMTAHWKGYYSFSQVRYWLDGVMLGQLDDLPEPFSVTLTGLSDARHSVEVTAAANWTSVYIRGIGILSTQFPSVSSGKIYFSVDTTPSSMPFLSPQNKTYDTVDIPLNFTVSEPVSWIGYSLDGKANVTATECVSNVTDSYGQFDIVRFTVNTVLTGLPEGSHSLTVYSKDSVGNMGRSETIHFTIVKETEPGPNPSPFPAALVAATFVSITAISAGLLLFYFWKRNH
jgi:hypothetical protein